MKKEELIEKWKKRIFSLDNEENISPYVVIAHGFMLRIIYEFLEDLRSLET
jgi:hypothetical protein